jgi:hypothetical protein
MRLAISAAIVAALTLFGSAPAAARVVRHQHHHRVHHHAHHHHHHHFRRHQVRRQAVPISSLFGSLFGERNTAVDLPEPSARSVSRSVNNARPSDCRGIAWCGCWLRHRLGIADKSYNLARNWVRLGQRTSPRAGVVVVWNHHVGLLRSDPDARGRALVLSGNDGHRVRERVRSLRGAIAFRAL